MAQTAPARTRRSPARPGGLPALVRLPTSMDQVLALVPVVVLAALAMGATLAWTDSRTELAYLRAAEPIGATLDESGRWVAQAGEADTTRARAFDTAEVAMPRERRTWLGLVGMASLGALGAALLQARRSTVPQCTGRAVPLVPSLA